MLKENNSFDIFDKISKEERNKWRLYIDAEYCSNPYSKNISEEEFINRISNK